MGQVVRWLARVKVGLLMVLFQLTGTVVAQKVTAAPAVDLNRFTGVWYEIARLPVKAEKRCAGDATVLYALGDKKRTLQRGSFCVLANGTSQDQESSLKTAKDGSGQWKARRFFFLSSKYWVLASAQDYSWTLVGSPNHKTLWILSRTSALPPDTYKQLLDQASGQGFQTAKLLTVTQHPGRSAISASGVTPPKTPAAPPGTTPDGSNQP